MSLRNEQCNKVCRILDDVLANRPTERDSLITAVRKAFGALETEPQWIPCSERLPEKDGRYQVTRYDYVANTEFIDILWYEENLWWNRHSTGDYAVTAWVPLPKPYQGKERRTDGKTT